MTTSTTKSPLIVKENSHVALIQPAQYDVGPIIEYFNTCIIDVCWCAMKTECTT